MTNVWLVYGRARERERLLYGCFAQRRAVRQKARANCKSIRITYGRFAQRRVVRRKEKEQTASLLEYIRTWRAEIGRASCRERVYVLV